MFGLDEDLRSNFNKIFASFPEIEKVIIYGSRAKGNYREGSDIDLCLVGDDLNEAIRKRVWLMLDELNTPYLIDLSVFNQLESEILIDHIQRVGEIFYMKQN